jgi:hypothetical protein
LSKTIEAIDFVQKALDKAIPAAIHSKGKTATAGDVLDAIGLLQETAKEYFGLESAKIEVKFHGNDIDINAEILPDLKTKLAAINGRVRHCPPDQDDTVGFISAEDWRADYEVLIFANREDYLAAFPVQESAL